MITTLIRALRAGDFELVRTHATVLIELLEELRRRQDNERPPPCARCAGTGQWCVLGGPLIPCPDCGGEGVARAEIR